ncbi:hypothetical protein B0T14DRAFT_341289 [Immersiella caudata]|uniref:Zn(2)-C6 fungal-type domain-containing protein n=1 Tax=Immersiella caudata TaxID=314043 RepID=A0AA39U6K3_9PEZI|nr:hypothetical protein B0T14DRAFT_341289 [Immersiella caudata]
MMTTRDSETGRAGEASQRRRPVPGKGHRKSKSGCANCKARRVKCTEEIPNCRACRRLGLDCRYASPPLPPPIALAGHFRTAPSALTFEDLRFFHHFLTAAHPPLPFGERKVWQDVAAISHEYDFLAHAMMGLAAQSLTASTSADYSIQALNHRVKAITAMNEALSKSEVSDVDGDARLAAAMILTFQSSNMDDGMMEFLRMLRGWMIIQTTVVPSMAQSLFHGFTEEAYVESMRSHIMQGTPSAPSSSTSDHELQEALENFDASLRIVGPICQSPAELRYLSSLRRVAIVAKTDPLEACLELVPLYAMTNEMDVHEFAHFTDDNNLAAQILLVHFWMLTWVLDSLGPAHGFAMQERTVLRWVERTAQRLPQSHRHFVLWPLGMADPRS